MSKHTLGPTATIPDDWEPTAENIRALPRPLRKYIHDLETDCDPAGTIRSEVLLREHTVPALTARVAELEAELAAVSKFDGKHTPGTWYAKGCGIYCGELGEYLLAATGDDEGHFSAEEQQANAHLIAAAPEMLEALKVVTDTLIEWLPRLRGGRDVEELSRAYVAEQIAMAQAAIAKAEGRK